MRYIKNGKSRLDGYSLAKVLWSESKYEAAIRMVSQVSADTGIDLVGEFISDCVRRGDIEHMSQLIAIGYEIASRTGTDVNNDTLKSFTEFASSCEQTAIN